MRLRLGIRDRYVLRNALEGERMIDIKSTSTFSPPYLNRLNGPYGLHWHSLLGLIGLRLGWHTESDGSEAIVDIASIRNLLGDLLGVLLLIIAAVDVSRCLWLGTGWKTGCAVTEWSSTGIGHRHAVLIVDSGIESTI